MQPTGLGKRPWLLAGMAVLTGALTIVGWTMWRRPAGESEAKRNTTGQAAGAPCGGSALAANQGIPAHRVSLSADDQAPALPVVDLEGTSRRVKLPGKLLDLALAANGRRLVLRLQGHATLLVYDVASGELVGAVPADDQPVCFAAGRDKLVLGLWGRSVIQRWNLRTLQLETERLVVGDDAPVGLAMGADSAGPVLAVKHGGGSDLLDLETLEPLDLEIDRRARVWKHYPTSQHRVSADGRVFCAWDYRTLVAGVNVLTVEDGRALYAASADSVGHVCPDSDGTYLFTAVGRHRVDERPDPFGRPPGFVVPAIDGPLFLRIQIGSEASGPRFTLFSSNHSEPVATVRGLELAGVEDTQVYCAFDEKLQLPFPPDRRLILIPAVGQILGLEADLRSVKHWAFDFARWQ
jgi:hypothetical protein